jgi:hypothetical protein
MMADVYSLPRMRLSRDTYSIDCDDLEAILPAGTEVLLLEVRDGTSYYYVEGHFGWGLEYCHEDITA